MPSLLELSQDMVLLDDLLEQTAGEITPEVQAALDTWAKDLDIAFDNAIDQNAALICELERRSEIRDGEARRMAAKSKRDQSAADFLRQRLKAVFEDRGVKKIQTNRFTVGIVNNGGKLAMDLDENAVPDSYLRMPPPVPDTERIRKDLEEGTVLEFAKLKDRGTRLSIK